MHRKHFLTYKYFAVVLILRFHVSAIYLSIYFYFNPLHLNANICISDAEHFHTHSHIPNIKNAKHIENVISWCIIIIVKMATIELLHWKRGGRWRRVNICIPGWLYEVRCAFFRQSWLAIFNYQKQKYHKSYDMSYDISKTWGTCTFCKSFIINLHLPQIKNLSS